MAAFIPGASPPLVKIAIRGIVGRSSGAAYHEPGVYSLGVSAQSARSNPDDVMTVHVERAPPVTTVVLDRPDVRNAVDRATAHELADAFRAFEADSEALVGVLHGANGTFCSGADLKALPTAAANRVAPTGTDRWARRGCCSASR
jgi:hypothetical protein